MILPALFHGQGDRDASHDLIQLEVSFRTAGISVMAIDASLGDGKIRVHGLEIVFSAYFRDANIGPGRVSFNGFKPCVLEFICRTIFRVDRPETDESKVDPQP